jgi:hypothetical protein
MPIYDTPMSANVEIYAERFRSIVKFEVVHPDGILKLISEDLSIKNILSSGQTYVLQRSM